MEDNFFMSWPGSRAAPECPTLEQITARVAELRKAIGPPSPATDRLIANARARSAFVLPLDELAAVLAEREAAGRHKGRIEEREAAAGKTGRAVLADGLTGRVERAVAPLAAGVTTQVIDELARLTVDAERVRADLEAAERRGYERGVTDTVRAFWVAVCEQEARHHERVAASERRLNRMLGVNTCRAADEHEVIAAQYRAWAREGG